MAPMLNVILQIRPTLNNTLTNYSYILAYHKRKLQSLYVPYHNGSVAESQLAQIQPEQNSGWSCGWDP